MEDILRYYDYIRRLAESRSQDADDLVSETFLAAYSFLARGGVIEHPKTWLSNYLLPQTERLAEAQIPPADDSQSR